MPFETNAVTDRFLEALAALERGNDVEPMVGLYAAAADIGNVASPSTFTGPEGARDFWSTYRSWFGEIASSFRNVIAVDGRTALEWTSKGTSPEGEPVAYDGVSILEYQGGEIVRFRAYFNPELLGQQMQGHHALSGSRRSS